MVQRKEKEEEGRKGSYLAQLAASPKK